MRPAYRTRCHVCGERIVVADEWQYETKEVDGKKVTIKWFDPDRVILQHIRRVH